MEISFKNLTKSVPHEVSQDKGTQDLKKGKPDLNITPSRLNVRKTYFSLKFRVGGVICNFLQRTFKTFKFKYQVQKTNLSNRNNFLIA